MLDAHRTHRGRMAVVTRAARRHRYLELAQAPVPAHQMQTVSVVLPSSSFSKCLPSTRRRGEETALQASWVLEQSAQQPICSAVSAPEVGVVTNGPDGLSQPETREGIRVDVTLELSFKRCAGAGREPRVCPACRGTLCAHPTLG